MIQGDDFDSLSENLEHCLQMTALDILRRQEWLLVRLKMEKNLM